jgi:hypothetical protein
VRASVDSCSVEAKPPTCRLQIVSVLAYGMATPTLAAGRSIEVRAPVLQSEQGPGRQPARSGTAFTVVLRHEETPRFGDRADTRPAWEVIDLR